MLSVCIPVYNVDVTCLTEKLIKQADELSINIEILIYDDGSKNDYKIINRSLKSFDQIRYKELKKNIGSAAIRNRMAVDALYNSLLFIDSDSEIPVDYLEKYLPHITNSKMIVCGGRVHPKQLPSLDKSLRWKVGKFKEDFSAAHRNKVPNKSFMSNNFLVKRELFNKIQFDETIERSGHEDTMFGIKLELLGIHIFHIDNPIVHIGLESNMEFITKTEQRLETLKIIESKNGDNHLLYDRITILRYYRILKKLKLIGLSGVLFLRSKDFLSGLLQNTNPSMLIYDLYKLGYYSHISKKIIQ
ncbi:glycosyltransferase family 2 protein [Plebeiibacterium sediminum]|uniref:Glycosyltransferase family 2 protein n=1 Tax=Plebeiibacterium sediminum TaxID=2992112 RepID=A0AAE3M4Q1_9BACT|nr:glycosyltransferase family 2 protein [Plebeiobacterium sediminum]MCW3786921.1 glycosyltransferase family 2 protein [Plebeiobacterium sediminum]